MFVMSNSFLTSQKRSLVHSMRSKCCTVSRDGVSQHVSWRRRLARSKVQPGGVVLSVTAPHAVGDAADWPVKDEAISRLSAEADVSNSSRPCSTSVYGMVFAAAVWSGPEASWDEEQSWWSAGPLSWRTADEREQWRAEQQSLKQLNSNIQAPRVNKLAPANGEVIMSVDQEGVDVEQQWLQPPVQLESPQ